MSEGLVRKKRIRAGHRSVVTKRYSEAEALMGSGSPDGKEVYRYVSILEEKLVVLRRLDGEILDLIEDEAELITEIEAADTHNQKVHDLLLSMKDYLDAGPSASHTSVRDPPTSSTSLSSRQARLPKLALPMFDGKITGWFTFWELYEAAVHSNPDLSPVQKFSYLKTLLDGPAKEAVGGLSLTAESYTEAVDILTKRFGNKQKIIDKHMSILLSIERVSSASHIVALRHLYDKLETNTRALKALGVPEDTYGTLLSSVLMSKLPSEIQLMAGREIEGDWKLKEIMQIVSRELEIREKTSTVHEIRPTTSPEGRTDKKRPEKPSVATLMTGQDNKSDNRPSCCYCQRNHRPEECTVVTDVAERRKMLRASARCFTCTRKGHISRVCRSHTRCCVCHGKHHGSICHTLESPQVGSGSTQKRSTQTPIQSSTHLLAQSTSIPDPDRVRSFYSLRTETVERKSMQRTLLQTATVTLYNPDKQHKQMRGMIIFDTGSQQSYVIQRAAEDLQLRKCGSKVLSIATFGTKISRPQKFPMVRVGLKKGTLADMNLMLLVVPFICEPVKGISRMELEADHPRLSQLDLADDHLNVDGTEPTILIGLDYYWDFLTGETLRTDRDLVATRTTLGWTLSGPLPEKTEYHSATNLIVHVLRVTNVSRREETKRLERRLKAFWDLETLGILDVDDDVYKQFRQIVSFRDGRYVVSLPWKDPTIGLSSNYEVSLRRLRSLVRRLQQDPELFQQYNQVIQDQIDKGIVQVVTNPEESSSDRVHYLPHHAVIKQDKSTTKLRVVYDASAKTRTGSSLNDALLVGPKFNQRILDILIRFRIHQTALVADLEKAFLMVGVNQRDQEALRFLWVKDLRQDPSQVQVLKFTRVVFGVASSPFLLNATISYHLEENRETHPELVDQLKESTYVDDVVFGADDVHDALELYKGAKELFRKGGFNLRKFVTNDIHLQSIINDSEGVSATVPKLVDNESYAKAVLGNSQKTHPGEMKVLGVVWKVCSDDFVFDLSEMVKMANECLTPSKRQVASIVGRAYDPLGILTPLITPLKVFLQDVCSLKLEWDEPLPVAALQRWNSLIKGLHSEVGPVTIPRWIGTRITHASNSFRLCGFGDASVRAYAAVIYLQVDSHDGPPSCHLLCSKSRVAPTERLTIPRLELLSAVILARLMERVSKALSSVLSLEPPLCFLDSKVAYFWITGHDRSWKPFVQNRVTEVRRRVPSARWRHCAGILNPADAPSRGQDLKEFLQNRLWFTGPKHSLLDGECDSESLNMPSECYEELRRATRSRDTEGVIARGDIIPTLLTGGITQETGIGRVLEVANYSNINRLLRVTACILVAVTRFKTKGSRTENGDFLTVELMNEAETMWVRTGQVSLKADPRFNLLKAQLDLFMDDNQLIRCKGRLKHARMPYTTRFPLLLPRDHRLTHLLIKKAHEDVFHNGVKDTLTQLRTKYWVLKGRGLVKSIISKCVLCRRLEGPKYRSPRPPPLPSFRVEEAPPFVHCGVDFAGPLFVRMDRNAPCTTKVWICLYTCCTTRAIHLDLVQDLSTETFMRCFKRFVARRGLPQRVVSDNGKTFKGAAKVLKALTDVKTQNQLSEARVKWTFNIERAPWWGGFFERLVLSVKRCLRKVVGRAKLVYEELLTLLTEVEAILNSRPLSCISSQDLEQPLTPSHLIMGRRLLDLPESPTDLQKDEDYNSNPESLSKRVQFLKRIREHFWDRWRKEYLMELRNSHARKLTGQRGQEFIRRGDVVLIYDEHEKRSFWRLGVVEDLIQGQDGQVRGAKVKVSVNGTRTTIWRRPVERLYPLEVRSLDIVSELEEEISPGPQEPLEKSKDAPDIPQRAKRGAAMQARDRIQLMRDSNLI